MQLVVVIPEVIRLKTSIDVIRVPKAHTYIAPMDIRYIYGARSKPVSNEEDTS